MKLKIKLLKMTQKNHLRAWSYNISMAIDAKIPETICKFF